MSSEDEDYDDLDSVDHPQDGKRVQVCLRIRPMNKFETSRRSKNCIELHDDPRMLTVNSPLEGEYDFSFDRVFDEDATQVEVFDEAIAPMMDSLFQGINCTVICYGQSGSGKSHTMLGFDDGSSNNNTPEKPKTSQNPQDAEGVIPRVAAEVFDMIDESSPTIEYTVRCSYVEIFLEKVLDLLTPGGVGGVALCINDATSGDGAQINGVSELCCIDKPDVISLLNRGNAFRTASGIKMSTDSSRSHVVFIMKVEQRNRITGERKESVMHMLDLAGSEAASMTSSNTDGQQIQQSVSVEGMMNNKSIAALTSMVRAKAKKTGDTEVLEAALSQSKLTRLLHPSFGGNCLTTVLLAASPSSYNVGDTIDTLRFGKVCRGIWNSPTVNTEFNPEEFEKSLLENQQKHKEERLKWVEKERKLKALVKILLAECKGESDSDPLEDSHVMLALDEALQESEEDADHEEEDSGVTPRESEPEEGEKGDANDMIQAAKQEILRLGKVVDEANEAKDRAENAVSELQSEVAVLRSKNEFYSAESKKAMQELIDAEYEIQVVSQRKTELEHDLRMNLFREKELGIFLRQFRRFFNRLMKHRGAHGSGKIQELIAMVPGVPDMKGMMDIDTLLLEKGIIDEDDLESTEDSSADTPGDHEMNSEALEVSVLQKELLRVTEQCFELQIALREQQESATAAVLLAQGWGSMKKLIGGNEDADLAKDALMLQQQLERKNHDLQAVVWKMNELHVINDTFNDKMASREQRVIVLEKKLVDLQKVNGLILLSSQESEKKLRKELDNLRSLVDGMTVPLWQFGESRIKDRSIASRIVLPIVGGGANQEDQEGPVVAKNPEHSFLDRLIGKIDK